MANAIPTVMTIAGSDSGAGAGVQADLKTFAALGVYGTSVITAVTAQNTQQVTAIHEVPVRVIASQIQAVLVDIGADAVKTGMLSSVAIIRAVVRELRRAHVQKLVVDPVMVAKSGDRLLRTDAVDALCKQLLPLATVVTPNIPEAEVLSGMLIKGKEQAKQAARAIYDMGPEVVVVKGGHLEGPPMDLYYNGAEFHEFTGPRIETREHPRDRLHFRLRHRCRTGPGAWHTGGSEQGQRLSYRGDSGCVRRGAWPWTGQSFL